MFQKSRATRRRTIVRAGVGVGVALAAVLGLPGIASAHVSNQPGTVEGGEGAVIAVRVPNERDDASTTQLRVVLPVEHPIGSVRTTEMPGWKVTTSTRKLAQPIDVFGRKLDTVVAQVTWTAAEGGGIRPGQYKDFNLSLGPLPESGELVFSAVQTYSGGESVSWNEVSADKSVEPEHPAPVLQIVPPAADPAGAPSEAGAAGGATPDGTSDTAASTTSTAPAAVATDGSGTTALVLSAVALAVSLFAAFLAWRRGRPASAAAPGVMERATEDARP